MLGIKYDNKIIVETARNMQKIYGPINRCAVPRHTLFKTDLSCHLVTYKTSIK